MLQKKIKRSLSTAVLADQLLAFCRLLQVLQRVSLRVFEKKPSLSRMLFRCFNGCHFLSSAFSYGLLRQLSLLGWLLQQLLGHSLLLLLRVAVRVTALIRAPIAERLAKSCRFNWHTTPGKGLCFHTSHASMNPMYLRTHLKTILGYCLLCAFIYCYFLLWCIEQPMCLKCALKRLSLNNPKTKLMATLQTNEKITSEVAMVTSCQKCNLLSSLHNLLIIGSNYHRSSYQPDGITNKVHCSDQFNFGDQVWC